MLFEEQMTRNANARGLMDKDVLSQISPVIDYFFPRKHRGKKNLLWQKKYTFPALRRFSWGKNRLLSVQGSSAKLPYLKQSVTINHLDSRGHVTHFAQICVRFIWWGPFAGVVEMSVWYSPLSDRTWNWIKVNHGHPKWLFSLILLKGLHDVPTWKL